MTEKITYLKKPIVGERQIRRRVANSIKDIVQVNGSDNVSSFNIVDSHVSNSQENTESKSCYGENDFIQDGDLENDNADVSKIGSFNNLQCNLEPNLVSALNTSNDMKKMLQQWAVNHKISHSALNNLLKILSPFHSELSLDSRTLMKTPKQIETKELENGELIYLGLSMFLNEFVCQSPQIENNIIDISFNIDGLPLFHSSGTSLWPILGLIKT